MARSPWSALPARPGLRGKVVGSRLPARRHDALYTWTVQYMDRDEHMLYLDKALRALCVACMQMSQCILHEQRWGARALHGKHPV